MLMNAPLRLLVAALLFFCFPVNSPARPGGVFDIGPAKPSRAVVTADTSFPQTDFDTSEMMRTIAGVVADLNARDAATLGQAVVPGSKMLDARGALFRVGVVHLIGAKPANRKRVEILLSPDGVVVAQELDDDQGSPITDGRVVKLDPEKFRHLSINWGRYRGAFSDTRRGFVSPATPPPDPVPPDMLPGAVAAVSPVIPSPFFLDQQLLGDRFLAGRRSSIPGAARLLSQEKMFVRLPKDYNAKAPAGLLVWISPTADGEPPAGFTQALDELNIACIGIAEVGNDRPVADRYQLALDALFTASARVHIDPRRVYITGMSGGGRVASMLQACFPEYFTGAVPIVGLSCYEKVPLGNSRYAPAGYSRPREARFSLFKSRRMAAITGDQDFNQPEMLAAASIMKSDGVGVRVFEYEQFGHQMPSASQFVEALRWVDEPYQAGVTKQRQAAASILERYIKKHGEGPPRNPAARVELIKVTEAGPWTPAAWRAADWLYNGP